MVDPTSDVGEVDESDAPSCTVCGSKIVNSPDHVVVAWIDEGRVQHRDFCDDECRAEWTDERSGPDGKPMNPR